MSARMAGICMVVFAATFWLALVVGSQGIAIASLLLFVFSMLVMTCKMGRR
ncbi:MAG: hypothetical protein WBP12_01210 [Candidatus Saccharimonas sp.]